MIPSLGNPSVYQIGIETPANIPGTVSRFTALFRSDAHLPEAMNAAFERAGEGEPVHVVSAGCSDGAEVDSVLALHNVYGDGRELCVTGLDYNPFAIRVAESGNYCSMPTGNIDELVSNESILKRFGFDFRRESRGELGEALVINSKAVRSTHLCRFLLHNLLEQPKHAMQADLILANNVLYHLPVEERLKAAANLVGMLSERAVLSFGWFVGDLRPVAEMLKSEFGLEYIETGKPMEKTAYMFARP